MKKIILFACILFASFKTFAQQTDKDAVKQTINTMFDAMRKGDSKMLRSTFHKTLFLKVSLIKRMVP